MQSVIPQFAPSGETGHGVGVGVGGKHAGVSGEIGHGVDVGVGAHGGLAGCAGENGMQVGVAVGAQGGLGASDGGETGSHGVGVAVGGTQGGLRAGGEIGHGTPPATQFGFRLAAGPSQARPGATVRSDGRDVSRSGPPNAVPEPSSANSMPASASNATTMIHVLPFIPSPSRASCAQHRRPHGRICPPGYGA